MFLIDNIFSPKDLTAYVFLSSPYLNQYQSYLECNTCCFTPPEVLPVSRCPFVKTSC